jgi:HK97 gp10 family phage protein
MASIIKQVTVEGLSDSLDALEELSKATQTNVQKRALLKAAQPIVDAAKSNAPVLSGTLRDRIDVGTKLSKSQKSSYEKGSKVEVYIGPPPLVQAITSEFGTFQESPRPFMRPAWDGNKDNALEIIRKELGVEIEKARQRAAKKAERLAAQMSTKK